MSNQSKPRVFNGAEWRQKKTHARTLEALRQRDREFSQAHLYDTVEQHLAYLRRCAQELKHTPQMNEVLGGQMIAQRCGGWNRAVAAAGLPMPTRKIPDTQTRLYREEYTYQDQHFKEITQKEQQQKKVAGEAKAAQEKARGKAERAVHQERDALWAEAHKDLTYDGLADYLRRCAGELGRAPYSYEVEGGGYIRKYFGTWALALDHAGLEIPTGIQPPTPAQKQELLAKIKRCQPAVSPETYTNE